MADDLRQRIAAALVSTIGTATIILGSSVADMVGRRPGDVTECDLADAVMAVRDNELEQLKEDALAVVAESTREVQAWRERAEKAEAAIARARRLAEEWAELAEPGDESAASLDRAVADSGRDVLAALDSQETDRG